MNGTIRLFGGGAKNYTVHAFACRYWWRRLANGSELVYAGSILYGGCVNLKGMNDRVNAFNLVDFDVRTRNLAVAYTPCRLRLLTVNTNWHECTQAYDYLHAFSMHNAKLLFDIGPTTFNTFRFPLFPFLHFPAPAVLCCIFQSRIFHPCRFVPHFPVLHFHVSHFHRPRQN